MAALKKERSKQTYAQHAGARDAGCKGKEREVKSERRESEERERDREREREER